MAILNLTSVHAFPIDAPELGIFIRTQRLDVQAKALGKVNNYGRATRRAVTWDAQSSKILRITLNYNDRAGALTLADWVGQIVIVRDTCGMVAIGLLASIDTRDTADLSSLTLVPTVTAMLQLTTHPLATL